MEENKLSYATIAVRCFAGALTRFIRRLPNSSGEREKANRYCWHPKAESNIKKNSICNLMIGLGSPLCLFSSNRILFFFFRYSGVGRYLDILLL